MIWNYALVVVADGKDVLLESTTMEEANDLARRLHAEYDAAQVWIVCTASNQDGSLCLWPGTQSLVEHRLLLHRED